MAETYFGSAAATSPRIDFDMATPLLRGYGIGVQEGARALRAQVAAEEADAKRKAQIAKFITVDPAKVHPTLQAEYIKLFNDYVPAAIEASNKSPMEAALLKAEFDMKRQNIVANSDYRFSYDKSEKFLKDPEVDAAWRRGDIDSVRSLVKQKGLEGSAFDPESGVPVERTDIKVLANNKYGYANSPSLYEVISRTAGPEGTTYLTYGISKKSRDEIRRNMSHADEGLIMDQYPTEFRAQEKAIEESDEGKGMSRSQIRRMAAANVLVDNQTILPSHTERISPRSQTNIYTGEGSPKAIALTIGEYDNYNPSSLFANAAGNTRGPLVNIGLPGGNKDTYPLRIDPSFYYDVDGHKKVNNNKIIHFAPLTVEYKDINADGKREVVVKGEKQDQNGNPIFGPTGVAETLYVPYSDIDSKFLAEYRKYGISKGSLEKTLAESIESFNQAHAGDINFIAIDNPFLNTDISGKGKRKPNPISSTPGQQKLIKIPGWTKTP